LRQSVETALQQRTSRNWAAMSEKCQKRPFTHSLSFGDPPTKDKRPRGYYAAWPSRLFPSPPRDSVSGHIMCGWRRMS